MHYLKEMLVVDLLQRFIWLQVNLPFQRVIEAYKLQQKYIKR